MCSFFAILEKRNIVEKKDVFFGFLTPTNENKIKTLKKSLFRHKFCLYTNCIYYTCKRGFCVKCRSLKSVQKHVIYEIFGKKLYYRNIHCFLFIF